MLIRPWISSLVLLAGFTASACTAFYVPDEEDDGVARCDNTDDCEDPSDNRFVAACVYGEGQAENSSKVCVADFADDVSCNALGYAGDHPFTTTYEDALDSAAYVACLPENLGKQGCGASMAGCLDGLATNDLDLCDDDDPATPKAVAPNKLPEDIESSGQDVLDQFCRWRMAGEGGEDWTCDNTLSSGARCRQCDPEKELGAGGCGTIYLQGVPSSVYVDDRNDGTQDTEEVVFGPVP